jgi:hypothetical protein
MIEILSSIDPRLYQLIFETEFIKQTNSYYNQKSQEMMQNHALGDYLKKVKEFKVAEEQRGAAYLQPKTKTMVIDALLNQFMENHADLIVKGLHPLLEENKFEEIGLMYEFMKQSQPCLEMIKVHLK